MGAQGPPRVPRRDMGAQGPAGPLSGDMGAWKLQGPQHGDHPWGFGDHQDPCAGTPLRCRGSETIWTLCGDTVAQTPPGPSDTGTPFGDKGAQGPPMWGHTSNVGAVGTPTLCPFGRHGGLETAGPPPLFKHPPWGSSPPTQGPQIQRVPPQVTLECPPALLPPQL